MVGYVAQVFPDAQDNLVTALETVLPGLIGDGPDQISLIEVQDAAGTVGLIGLVVLVYSGLGWISCMRDALTRSSRSRSRSSRASSSASCATW